MLEQFEYANIKNYSFWTAFDGRNITNTTLSAKIIAGYGIGRDLTQGMLSLNIAHITAMKLAQYLDLPHVVIFEDDVILCKDWNKRLNMLLNSLPNDWEHVYLGGWTDYIKLAEVESPIFFKSPKMVGGWSYLVSKRGYQKMIDFCSNMTTIYDDIVMHMIEQGKLKSYSYMPWMAYPRGEDSDKHDMKLDNKGIKHGSYKFFRDIINEKDN